MLGTGLEDTSMEKFAGLFGALALTCGLAFAQSGGHSTGTTAVAIQQWHGTLVDASCAGSSNAKPADAASAPAEQVRSPWIRGVRTKRMPKPRVPLQAAL